MTTLKGNKLIAEFMGAFLWQSHLSVMKLVNGSRFPDRMYCCKIEKLEYHTSWDWLMTVVEKIEKEVLLDGCGTDKYNVPIKIGTDKIEIGQSQYHSWVDVENSKIEATWKAIVEFIQWYKTTLPKSSWPRIDTSTNLR